MPQSESPVHGAGGPALGGGGPGGSPSTELLLSCCSLQLYGSCRSLSCRMCLSPACTTLSSESSCARGELQGCQGSCAWVVGWCPGTPCSVERPPRFLPLLSLWCFDPREHTWVSPLTLGRGLPCWVWPISAFPRCGPACLWQLIQRRRRRGTWQLKAA